MGAEKRAERDEERFSLGGNNRPSHLVARSWQGGKGAEVMGYQKMLQEVSPHSFYIHRVSTFSLQPAGTGAKI